MSKTYKNAADDRYGKHIISDKHLVTGVIELIKEYFPSSIETKANNEYSSFKSMCSGSDNHSGDHNYLSGLNNKSNGCYSENGYENYEDAPDWDTYREAYPDQELPEIDPAELWAFWHEKEASL
jgi:hypothetical protein